ncbi:MAG TPA: Ig-like domain-containing protein [Gemmatimonadaceae bacterium]|nr:Ig-like domain-containing protein [Gemmatimonadaceae bacterium]
MLRTRHVAVTMATLMGAAACSPGSTGNAITPPKSGVTAVIVAPGQLNVISDAPVQFTAMVIGTGNVSQAVRWSVQPPNAATVTADGLVTVCFPASKFTVVATSLQDTTVSGLASVLAVSTLPGISIASITRSGTTTPATTDSIAGSVDIGATFNASGFACHAPTEADLIVTRAAGDTVVARQTFGAGVAGPQQVLLTFRSADSTAGHPAFPNGPYQMHVGLLLTGLATPVPSSTFNITVRNP